MDRPARVLHLAGDPDLVAAVAPALARETRLDVETVAEPAAALDRLDETEDDYDCLLSDLAPHTSAGAELLADVRARDPELPFVAVVRADDGRAAGDALAAGATDVVRVAADGDRTAPLVARVANAVEGARTRRREADRARTVVGALGDPVYALDADGRFSYVNDAFVDLLGYDRAEIVGSEPSLVKSPADVERAEHHLGRLLSADGPEQVTFELALQPADGPPIPCEDQMAALPFGPEGFAGSAGVLRNVSARRERERDLRAQRRLLERSIDTLDDVYYLLDPAGRIARWNRTLLEVTGYGADEIEGRDALDLFDEADHDRVRDAIETALETGSVRIEAPLVTADGESIPYEFTGARLPAADGGVRGVIGVGRDVSARRERERRLERQNERLEQFNQVVSHDLRNPLGVIEGVFSALEADETGDRPAEHVARGRRAAARMDALIDDLLALAREGETVTDPEPVALPALVADCLDGVETDPLTVDVDTDAVVLADRSRLRQLVENLLRNAVEHASAGDASGGAVGRDRPDAASTVTIGETADGFYVADDGPGIPPDERERVFESGHTTARRGTGLGLAIVERIADAHGWTVAVAESADGGARFEFGGVGFADAPERSPPGR
jgi:PAS domain S-box-containing protein